MTAVPGESPAVARRRVRLALRRAREASALSQSDVARRLGWSMSKMQRIEAGDVTVSGTDLRALLDLYGGFSDQDVKQLSEDARISRRQRWWTAPEYRQHLTAGLMQLLQFESEAVRIWAYQPVLVPGVLQTPATAAAIFAAWNEAARRHASDGEFLSETDRRVRMEVREVRRQQVIEREDAPSYHLVLDESVLGRDVGGPEIAAEQMETLAAAAQLSHVHIRVVPLDRGAVLGLLGPFMILELDEEDPDDAVLYSERTYSDVVVHDTRDVRNHRGYMETLWGHALPEDASLRRIEARAAVLRSNLDHLET